MSWATCLAVLLPRCGCSCLSTCYEQQRRRRSSDESDDAVVEEMTLMSHMDVTDKPPSGRRPLCDFFCADELARFGALAEQVFVVFDESLPATLHGKSVVENGVPLALVNPRAADPRYVILHECMHHVLDELGCPSLWVTVRPSFSSVPKPSWLGPVLFPVFARGALVQLWELIQHSRFNRMLKRVFNCSPHSARDAEYSRYIQRGCFQTFGLSSSGDPVHQAIEGAVHVATVLMEGSVVVQKAVLEFVHETYANGAEVVRMGQHIFEAIREEDHELRELQASELAGMFRGMLQDLKMVLSILAPEMGVWIGDIQPLQQKFKERCWTSVEVGGSCRSSSLDAHICTCVCVCVCSRARMCARLCLCVEYFRADFVWL